MNNELQPSLGRVFTFYSFKGGTGRSMALANVAWILASNGKTVLTVDWDLEAPGLHRYFAPFLEDKSMQETDGLIDLLYRYQVATTRPAQAGGSDRDVDWISQYADVQRYAEPIGWRFQGPGRIDLLGAGRQDSQYGERVNRFDWQAFYKKYGGGAFFEKMFAIARHEYDYILIDSRTGVSDTSGICTIQLPDALAVFYTLNDQSIEGASAVAKDALDKRRKLDDDYAFKVYPVATRIELAEKDKLERRRKTARAAFEPIVDHFLDQQQLDDFFGSIEVLYDPYYAYEEVLATVADQPGSKNSILSSFETLTSYLTDGKISRLTQVSEARRAEAKTQFVAERDTQEGVSKTQERYDVFISSSVGEREMAKSLSGKLQAFSKVFDDHKIQAGELWKDAIKNGIDGSKIVLAIIGRDISENQRFEIECSIARGKRVVPIWAKDESVALAQRVLPELHQRAAIDWRTGDEPDAILSSVRHMLGVQEPKKQRENNAEFYMSDDVRSAMGIGASKPNSFFKPVAIALLALLSLAAVLYQTQFFSDPSETLSAKANTLASQAVQLKDLNPVLALLLAKEAVAADPNEFAINTLRASLIGSTEVQQFVGDGRAFVTVKLDQSGNYAVAVDSVGNAFVYNLEDRAAAVVRIRKIREVVWGGVDRAGRPSLLAVRLDGSLVRWSTLGGLTRWGTLELSYNSDVAFSPTGDKLLHLNEKGNLSVWELPLRAGQPLFDINDVVKIPDNPWSSKGESFVIESLKGRYIVYSSAGEMLYAAESITSSNAISGALLSENGSRLLLLAGDASAIFDGAGKGRFLVSSMDTAFEQRNPLVEKYSGPIGRAVASAWLSNANVDGGNAFKQYAQVPDNQLLIGFSSGRIGQLQVSENEDRFIEIPVNVNGQSENVNKPSSISFFRAEPTGDRFLAVASNHMSIYQLSTPYVHSFIGHTQKINDVDWRGSRIVSAAQDGSVRVWDPDVEKLKIQFSTNDLIKLADKRTPRPLSKEEADKYELDYQPEVVRTISEAVLDEEIQPMKR